LCVRKSHFGKGVFARRLFRKGQQIGEVSGRIIVDAKYQSRQCVELSETHVLEPAAPFRYLNHSCEPNCELFSWRPDARGDDSHRVYVLALRTIRVGEELTIDYAWKAEAAIPCLCAADNCRGWIVAADELYRLERKLGRRLRGRPRKPS
jgi:SET domain-containing protein